MLLVSAMGDHLLKGKFSLGIAIGTDESCLLCKGQRIVEYEQRKLINEYDIWTLL